MFSTKFWFLDPIPREGQMPVLPPPPANAHGFHSLFWRHRATQHCGCNIYSVHSAKACGFMMLPDHEVRSWIALVRSFLFQISSLDWHASSNDFTASLVSCRKAQVLPWITTLKVSNRFTLQVILKPPKTVRQWFEKCSLLRVGLYAVIAHDRGSKISKGLKYGQKCISGWYGPLTSLLTQSCMISAAHQVSTHILIVYGNTT